MPKDLFHVTPAATFIVTNCTALDHAALLLGGSAAQKRVRKLVDDLTTAPLLTRRHHRELDALEDLLSLRHVHDDERIEAARFAAIDPCDPAVEEICVLLDGLRNARKQELWLV